VTHASTSDERATLRATQRARRAALPASERVAAARGVLAQLEQVPEFMTDTRIAGYWAIGGELPLATVVGSLLARGQHYCLPVLGDDRTLRFATWKPGDALQPNRFGIPEPVCTPDALLVPAQLDVVLVPLLGFDREGNRLGMGGGWYDRSFAFLRTRTTVARPVLVGVGYAMQEVGHVPTEAWDVRLDYVATERELIDLAGEP